MKFLLCCCLALVACGPSMRGDDDGMGSGSGSGSDPPPGMAMECNKMDIVFVVDDSGSMQEEQSNLATNFPMFANLLSTYTTSDGQHIDYRVAVTTTGRDLHYTINLGAGFPPMMMSEQGDNGAFRNSCNVAKRWIEPSDPNMNQSLACRANVGTGGPGFEMPLLMSKWALSERMMDNTNVGFLRDDALLAIVYLTDEDDQSTTEDNFTIDLTSNGPQPNWNPTDQVQFLDTLKGNRTRWAAAAIAGDGDCSSSFGSAANAARLKDFVQQANSGGSTQAIFSSICAGDLTIGLKEALDTFQAACGGIIL